MTFQGEWEAMLLALGELVDTGREQGRHLKDLGAQGPKVEEQS